MSATFKSLTYKTTMEEGDENFQNNHQRINIDERYMRPKCIHDSCEDRSVLMSKINLIIAEEAEVVSEEEYVDLEQKTEEVGLDEALGACDFTDAECGEPMQSQFLRLDFTPVAGIDDNPLLQKKCSDFWQYLCSQQQLQRLMVSPEKGYEEVVTASSSKTSLEKSEIIPTPAAEWLETGVGHNLAFAAKHQSKFCDHHNEEYTNEELPPEHDAFVRKKSFGRGNVQTRTTRRLSHQVTEKNKLSTSNAVALCTQLEKWDKQHPKSNDPPGRVPNLTHAILQRHRQER